jgi:hypothetical protein
VLREASQLQVDLGDRLVDGRIGCHVERLSPGVAEGRHVRGRLRTPTIGAGR